MFALVSYKSLTKRREKIEINTNAMPLHTSTHLDAALDSNTQEKLHLVS
jgi:hypothetical protein